LAAPGPLFLSRDLGGLRLHLHRTRAFKTVFVKLAFHADLDAGTAARALVPRVLGRGTRSLPSLKALQERLDEMFGASLAGEPRKVGERHLVVFRAECLADRVAGRPLLAETARLLGELLHAPAVDADGGLRAEVVEQERKVMADEAAAVFDDKARFARHRLIEIMCRGEPYARPSIGREAEIRALSVEDVRRAYRALLDRAPADLFLVGDLGWREAESFAATLRLAGRARLARPRAPVRRRPRRARVVVERQPVEQGKLEMGFRTPVTMRHRLYPGLVMANMLFGGSPTGRLFKIVREKASLCYSISSGIERTKGLVFVQAGIDPDRFSRARRMILAQLSELARGRIAEEEEHQARATLLSTLRALGDRPGAMVEFALERAVNGLPADLAGAMEAIRRVPAREIAGAARTVRLDTVYFLRNG
jgi:predicted Zn-dependent peptidase